MTGYGGAEIEQNGVRISVEARSVNHRFVEVSVKSPNKNMALEDMARKKIKARFGRGSFDIYIAAENTGAGADVRINEALLKGYLRAASELIERGQVASPPTFGDLVSIRDMFMVSGGYADSPALETAAMAALDTAIVRLAEMRTTEGANITRDLKERMARIGVWTARIKVINERSVQERYDTLREKIIKLTHDAAVDQARLAQEAAIIAERSDISEEITRIESHLAETGPILDGKDPAGRKLEFLLQELGRETNTIGSKSFSAEITRLALDIKGDLEKLREQAQNLE
jgi:uncharacterized protein (TIGR00255 family)